MFTAKIDRQSKVILVSRSTLVAAGQFGTPEFAQMMEMRQKFPGYEFREQKTDRNPDKRTYGNLTYRPLFYIDKTSVLCYVMTEKQMR